MKVAVIYNKQKDAEGVINIFGMQNQETYNPKTVERVASSLERGGHNVRVIDGNINVIEQLQDFMPRVVQGEQPGMVFNMAYGLQGISRYTHIPSLLEMLGVPYVGSQPRRPWNCFGQSDHESDDSSGRVTHRSLLGFL